MIRETFPVGLLACNCTILGDEQTLDAIVVDPGDDLPRILAVLERHRLRVTRILITHAHIDHIAAAHQLKELTGAPIAYSQRDLPLIAMMDAQAAWLGMANPDVRPPDQDLTDNLSFSVASIQGMALHTPGHTQGSTCLYLPSEALLLAGDTLFAGSVGRSDLPGGDGRMLLRSIHARLLPLPEVTTVVPGHGPETSIGQERERDPFLRKI